MVIIKVSDGVETRKLRISGEVTFIQLQEKLATLFPHSVQGDKPLTLQYRDSDGDLITASSDEEFQGVLSTLANDAVLRLYIKGSAKSSRPRSCGHHGRSLFDLLEPSSSSIWDNFDKQLRQTESLFQRLLEEVLDDEPSSNSEGSKNEHTSTDKTEQTETPKEDDETVKSKLKEEPVKSKTEHEEDQTPVIHHKTVVSFEPRVQYSWFGPRTVFRPVRYNVVYWGQPEQPSKKSGEQTTSTDKPTNQETSTDRPTPQESTQSEQPTPQEITVN